MKKILIIVIALILACTISLITYWNLPIEITRKSDIKAGNELIKNIENYKKTSHKLPYENDWETLERLGFKRNDSENPVYSTDQKGNYELVYYEGFDGPYLMWNSQERKWTIDFPKITSK